MYVTDRPPPTSLNPNTSTKYVTLAFAPSFIIKRTEHLPIDQVMHPGYVAGFMDSDGCIHVDARGSRRYEVGQKYEAICVALKNQYGGSISKDKNECFHWRVSWNDGEKFITDIAPYLISKRKQAELAIGKKAGDALNVRAQMKILKNRLG